MFIKKPEHKTYLQINSKEIPIWYAQEVQLLNYAATQSQTQAASLSLQKILEKSRYTYAKGNLAVLLDHMNRDLFFGEDKTFVVHSIGTDVDGEASFCIVNDVLYLFVYNEMYVELGLLGRKAAFPKGQRWCMFDGLCNVRYTYCVE